MCTYRPINSYLLPNDPIGKYRHTCCHHGSLDFSRTEDISNSIEDLKRVLYRLEVNGQASSRQIREAENIVRKIDFQENRKDMLDYHDKSEIKFELARLKHQLDDMKFSVDASLHHRDNCRGCIQSMNDAAGSSSSEYEDDVDAGDEIRLAGGRRSRKNSIKDSVDARPGSVYHVNCHQGPFDASYNNNNVAFMRSKSYEKLPKERNLRSRSPSPTRRYFKPRKAGDLRPGDWVKFKRRSMNNYSCGQCKYVGHLPGKNGVYIGVELNKEAGKNSGTLNGFEYFKCKNNRGIFVPFNKIHQAWTYTS